MKKICALVLCLALFLPLAGCGGPKKYSAETFAFDTVIGLTAYCQKEEDFLALKSIVFGRMNELHRKFDIFNDYQGLTNLYTVNRAKGQPVAVDDDIGRLLELSLQLYADTDGLVNVAQGRLYGLWRQARETGVLPREEELRFAMEHGDMADVRWEKGTVTLLDPEMALDVGAVAKGLAAQLAAEAADEAGFSDYVISAGGNIVARGMAEGQRPWSVGIRDPRSDNANAHSAVVETTGGALVTSGGYERQLVVEGKSYCHIIDPRTGYPADKVLSATAICADSGLADGYSTALFLMDVQEGLDFAEKMGFRAILIDQEGTVRDSDQ